MVRKVLEMTFDPNILIWGQHGMTQAITATRLPFGPDILTYINFTGEFF